MLSLKRVIVLKLVETDSSFHTVMTRSLENSDPIRVYLETFIQFIFVTSGATMWAPFDEFVKV